MRFNWVCVFLHLRVTIVARRFLLNWACFVPFGDRRHLCRATRRAIWFSRWRRISVTPEILTESPTVHSVTAHSDAVTVCNGYVLVYIKCLRKLWVGVKCSRCVMSLVKLVKLVLSRILDGHELRTRRHLPPRLPRCRQQEAGEPPRTEPLGPSTNHCLFDTKTMLFFSCVVILSGIVLEWLVHITWRLFLSNKIEKKKNE